MTPLPQLSADPDLEPETPAPIASVSVAGARTGQGIARAALLVMVFYVLSRVLGLVREVIIGARFGTSADYDAYLAAFRVPDLLFQLVAGGALGSAFIPVFAAFWVRSEQAAAWRLFSRVLTLITLILMALAALAAVFALPLVRYVIAPGFSLEQQVLTAQLMRVMLPSTIIFGASGLVMGALNATQHFLWPAAAPVFYNLAIIMAAWLLAPRFGVFGLAIGVVVGALAHLLVQIPQLHRSGMHYSQGIDVQDRDVREVLRLMGPRVLGLFFVQMHFLVNTILASGLVSGSLSALNYAWLLMLLPLGVFAQSVATAVFPTFAAQIAAGDRPAMQRTFSQTLRMVLFLIIPSAVGLLTFGAVIVRLLLERGQFTASSTQMVATALAFYALGLAGHATLEITVRAFYSLHNTWTPVLVGVGAMALNVALSLWLVTPLGFGGLALANSTATTLEALLLLAILRRSMGGLDLRRLADSLLRTAAAAGLMGLFLFLFNRWAWPASATTAATASAAAAWGGIVGLIAGVAVYLLAGVALRNPELQQVMALARRRLRRTTV